MSELLLEETTKKTFEYFLKNKIKIIIPELYKEKFLLFLKNNKKITINEALSKDFNSINQMYDLITKNLHESKNNTEKAIEAIKKNNLSDLKKIISRMELLIEKMNKLENELYIDTLTEVKNIKWLFDKYLLHRKFNTKGILGFIDLDNFKLINDNYGHVVGDKVLKHMVTFIKQQLKENNVQNYKMIRYAGDEFLLIFENYLMIDIKPIINKIQKEYSKKKLMVRNHQFYSSFSIGFSGFLKNDTFDNIIEKADKKMYFNKKKLKDK